VKPTHSDTIDLDRFLPYRLSVLPNVVSSTIAEAYQRRFGLSIPEWRVLAVLARHPGLSASEVARLTRMDAVAVSRAVARLVGAGRLRRTVARDDRRRSVLAVTAAGSAVYREVAPLALGYERELLAALGAAERVALDRALDALTTRAQALSEARVALRQRRPRVGRRS
jgi:DNA-binding MarR family transcriptional regulator